VLGVILLDLDGEAGDGDKTWKRDEWVGGERSLVESKEQDLEVCKPCEEEPYGARQMHRRKAQRNHNVQEDDRKKKEESYCSCRNNLADPITVA